jgi:hypothetical protein
MGQRNRVIMSEANMARSLSTYIPILVVSAVLTIGSLLHAAQDQKSPVLSDADKRYLAELAKDFLFDPAVAKRVRIKTTVRDVWTKSRTTEREGWFVPAKDDRPARVYFTDGEYLPAPPEKQIITLDAGRTIRAQLGLDEKRKVADEDVMDG